MKTLIIFSALILIALTLACRSTRLSNRQNARLEVQEQSDTKTRVQESNRYDRFESLTDSNGQSFQLTIFPADTFRFSIRDGFIGKATKVVLTGSSKQRIRTSDTSKYVGSVTSELEETMTRDLAAKMKDRSVSVERNRVIWQGLAIGLIIGLIFLGLWKYIGSEINFRRGHKG